MDKLFGKKPTMKGNYFNCNFICLNFKYQKIYIYTIYLCYDLKYFRTSPRRRAGYPKANKRGRTGQTRA